MNAHLSSEQIERALAGKADAATTEHISACAPCAEETARMRALLGAFRQSATELSAMERNRAVVTRTASPRRTGVWATVAAAVVFAAVIVPVATRHGAVSPQSPLAANPSTATATVSDAELMTSIQNDLASSVPEPMQALEGTEKQTGSSNTNSNQKD